MHHPATWTGFLLLVLALAGCASSNYEFDSLPEGPTRIDQLARDLDRTRTDEGNARDDLHDLSVIPLIHSRLHVFSERDDATAPAGYVEAEIESSLPLFGFVGGEVSHYDTERQLVTRHEFDSALWGAFRNHREFVVTRAGVREKTRHTFLWLFDWCGAERWHPTGDQSPDGPEAP